MAVVSLDRDRAPRADAEPRYEVLPFGDVEEQAAAIGTPLRLTVTTSPKHGVDRSLALAVRLRERGHRLTVHLAARMVRSESHLDEIVGRAHDASIDDFFVIGGDAPEPLGPTRRPARCSRCWRRTGSGRAGSGSAAIPRATR